MSRQSSSPASPGSRPTWPSTATRRCRCASSPTDTPIPNDPGRLFRAALFDMAACAATPAGTRAGAGGWTVGLRLPKPALTARSSTCELYLTGGRRMSENLTSEERMGLLTAIAHPLRLRVIAELAGSRDQHGLPRVHPQ